VSSPTTRRPFRFQAAWLTHRGFYPLVCENVHNDMEFSAALEGLTAKVKWWNSNVFGNIHWRKKRIWARLEGICRAIENRVSHHLIGLERKLKQKYNPPRRAFMVSKVTVKVDFGERKTKSFHTTLPLWAHPPRTRKRSKASWRKSSRNRWPTLRPVIR